MNRDIIRRAILVIAVTCMMLLPIVLIVYAKITRGFGVPCPIRDMTGLYCFGCGGTRVAEALINLDFVRALRCNLLVCISVPILIPMYVVQSYLFIVKNKIISWIDRFAFAYLICIGLFMVLRNTQMFSWLAPVL
jgi:hypothetical protein